MPADCWVLTLVPSTCPCCPLVPPGACSLKPRGRRSSLWSPGLLPRALWRDFPGWEVGLLGPHSTVNAPLIIRDTHLRWPAFYPLLCSFTKREPPKWTLFPRDLEEFSQGQECHLLPQPWCFKRVKWEHFVILGFMLLPSSPFHHTAQGSEIWIIFNLPFLLLLFW